MRVSTIWAAMVASIALPPARSISSAARLACGLAVATIVRWARTPGCACTPLAASGATALAFEAIARLRTSPASPTQDSPTLASERGLSVGAVLRDLARLDPGPGTMGLTVDIAELMARNATIRADADWRLAEPARPSVAIYRSPHEPA